MKCSSFRLLQFRNIEDKTFYPDPLLTLFIGANGVGKTNILEGLFFALTGKSFRTGNEEEMMTLGKAESTVFLSFKMRGALQNIKIKMEKGKSKKIFINDTPAKRKELLGLFPTVLFYPDEMQLIKGEPYRRRRFIDTSLSQVSPRYYEELTRYNRAVQQRNSVFKNEKYTGIQSETELWDMQIAKSGSYLVKKRREAIHKLNRYVGPITNFLTDEKESLKLRYSQKEGKEIHDDEEWFLHMLSAKKEEDRKFCHTSLGPHRDDIIFEMNGLDSSSYGSQGQQRTAILAIKLAELDFIHEESGEKPLFLLDDFGSEMDRYRRDSFLSYVAKKDIQTIATATEDVFRGKGTCILID